MIVWLMNAVFFTSKLYAYVPPNALPGFCTVVLPLMKCDVVTGDCPTIEGVERVTLHWAFVRTHPSDRPPLAPSWLSVWKCALYSALNEASVLVVGLTCTWSATG